MRRQSVQGPTAKQAEIMNGDARMRYFTMGEGKREMKMHKTDIHKGGGRGSKVIKLYETVPRIH